MSKKVKIGYIGGGSRRWAYKLINDLAQCRDMQGEVVLFDLNYESAKRNEQFGNWVQKLEGAQGKWRYIAVEQREDALREADFVILSIEPGSMQAMANDLDIPKKYGIFRSVGVSVGPAGVLRSMRIIPIYRDFARAIRDLCPKAWVINYSNPMAVCVKTLYKEFPTIKAIGCCHGVFKLQKLFSSLITKYYDVQEPQRREIEINVQGINHFTWVDEARWHGQDLFPLLDKHLDENGVIRSFSSAELKNETTFVNNFQVCFLLYRVYGVLPAGGDRELVDFVPSFLKIDKPEDIHRWGIKLTPSEYRLKMGEEAPKKFYKHMSGEEKFEFFDSGEEGIDQMQALLGLEDLKTNVNLPNHGQQIDIPENSVVETNALFTEDRVQPLVSGRLPKTVHSMIMKHVFNQDSIVDAGFEHNVDLAFQVFLNDPSLTLPPDDARSLFIEMINATAQYLHDWDLSKSRILSSNYTI